TSGSSQSMRKSATPAAKSEHLDTEVCNLSIEVEHLGTEVRDLDIEVEHLDTEIRDLDIEVGASRHRGPRSRYRGRSISTPRSAISISRSDDLDTEVRDLDIEVGASRHRGPRSRYRGRSISTPRFAIPISRSEHVDCVLPHSRHLDRARSRRGTAP